MPAFLDEKGRAEWMRVMAELEEANVVRRIDGLLLAGYCDAVSRAIRASEASRESSEWTSRANQTWTVVRQFAAVFGIGPAERGRVAGSPKPGDPDKARMLA